jgi:hypothetical protein
MATNRDLLKEAIADAKAVKETAIANAKAALTESFTPFLREKLSAKIQEMDADDDTEDMDEMMYDEAEMENEGLDEISLDELLAELEENDSKMEDENLYEAKEEEEMEEDEEMSIEDMNEDDLKSFIEDVIKDMVAAGELEASEEEHEAAESEEEEKAEHAKGGSEEGEEEEEGELDLDELLAEIELDEDHAYSKKAKDVTPKSKNAIFAKGKDEYVTDETEEDDAPYSKEKAEKLSFHENELEEGIWSKIKGTASGIAKAANMFKQPAEFVKEMEAALKEDPKLKDDQEFMASYNFIKGLATAAKAGATTTVNKPMEEEINELKSELNEINLLNAKLLYTNKIFRSKSLSESQKIKVLTAFDKAKSKKEAQLVYETLLESLKVSTVGAKTSIKESLGSASKVLGSANAKPIIENDAFSRMRELAGIKK